MPQDSKRANRAAKRSEETSSEPLTEVLAATREVIESSGEGDKELVIPKISEDSKMEETKTAIKELGRLMIQNTNELGRLMIQNTNDQIQRMREREEANIERYKQLLEGQSKYHRQDTENLAEQFEKMRLEKEQARSRQSQRLPAYDGSNMDVDEWQERVDAVMKCNDWGFDRLMEILPTCLIGQAKISFDTLTDDEKVTKEVFFRNMREKIDPKAEKKNKELFMMTSKGATESISSYIDRCRMYIRRSGADPNEPFPVDMLKYKVYDSLSPTDRKILNGAVDHGDDLDKIISKADSMLATQTAMVGGVMDDPSENNYFSQMGPDVLNMGRGPNCENLQVENRSPQTPPWEACDQPSFNGICWTCGQQGHRSRDCYMGDPYLQYDGYHHEPVQNEAEYFNDQSAYTASYTDNYDQRVLEIRTDESSTEGHSPERDWTQTLGKTPLKNLTPQLPPKETMATGDEKV